MLLRNLLSVAVLSSALALPVSAQTPSFDTAAIEAACASSGATCSIAVQAAIAALSAAGVTGAALNVQLGLIAGVAVDAAQSLPASQRAGLVAALSAIAAASTDAAQIASLNTLSASVTSDTFGGLTAVAEAGSSN